MKRLRFMKYVLFLAAFGLAMWRMPDLITRFESLTGVGRTAEAEPARSTSTFSDVRAINDQIANLNKPPRPSFQESMVIYSPDAGSLTDEERTALMEEAERMRQNSVFTGRPKRVKVVRAEDDS